MANAYPVSLDITLIIANASFALVNAHYVLIRLTARPVPTGTIKKQTSVSAHVQITKYQMAQNVMCARQTAPSAI